MQYNTLLCSDHLHEILLRYIWLARLKRISTLWNHNFKELFAKLRLQMTESLFSPLNKQFPNLKSAGLPPDSDLSSVKALITILTDPSLFEMQHTFCGSNSRHMTVWAGPSRGVSDRHHKGLNWTLKLSVGVWIRRVRSPCWMQEGVKRRAIITVWRGKRWLATRPPPHWPPLKLH